MENYIGTKLIKAPPMTNRGFQEEIKGFGLLVILN